MADTLTNQLLPASFRGVPFLVRGEVLPEEGRKIVLHEYVNSSERFVEDLGGLPSRFRVTAFVHGTEYKARADALRNALNQTGPGELSLPVFGVVEAYALPYSADASQKSVGEVEFRLEFALGRPAAGPATALPDIEDVYDFGDAARSAIEVELGRVWDGVTTAANAAVADFDLLQTIVSARSDFLQSLPTETLGEIDKLVNDVEFGGQNIIRSGVSLGRTLIGAVDDAFGLWRSISLGASRLAASGSNIFSAFDAALSQTSSGSSGALSLSPIRGAVLQSTSSGAIMLWPNNTAPRISRNNNRLNLVNANRVAALVSAYEIAAAQDYKTQDDINDARSRLEDANERIMRVDTSDAHLVQSASSVRSAVSSVRLNALAVMEQKRQEAFDTITLTNNPRVSAFASAYNLYAEEFTSPSGIEGRAIDLRNLNPDKKSILLNGSIEAFRG